MFVRLLLFVAVVYFLLLLLIFVFQRSLMYYPKGYEAVAEGFTEVELKAADDVKVYVWEKFSHEDAPVIIYFHGNAENNQTAAPFLNELSAAGFNVIGAEYRGYGRSKDKITEAGLYNDARAVLEYIKTKVPIKNVILYGRSLGTGVALKMASEYEVGGVVLHSPYSSIEDVAANIYYYLPVKRLSLLRDKYISTKVIGSVKAPILVVQGSRDALVPISHTDALLAGFKGEKDVLTFENADHIEGFDTMVISERIRKFFEGRLK